MPEEVEALRRDLRATREELARVEEQLRKAKAERSRASDPAKAMSSLRQELRTPLNTVLGFAQLLKSSPFGECEAVEQIFSAATRLAELIDESSATATSNGNGQRASEAQLKPTKSRLDESHTVLCIEDNAANSLLIERIFRQRSNINLVFATQGSEGLTQARKHRPDLILLDLNLPDVHGSEVLRALRQDKRTESLPVVVISADATASQIEQLLCSGARNYLTKPIDVARFLYTVDEILNGPPRAARGPAHNFAAD